LFQNNLFLSLAFRNIFRHVTRSLITLMVITTGCISLIVARGFLEDDVQQLRDMSIRQNLGHLRIYQADYLDKGLLHPFDYLITTPDEMLQQLSTTPHVQAVSPRLSLSGLVSNGDVTLTFIGQAVDPDREPQLRKDSQMTAGQFLEKTAPFGILLGVGLAKALGVQPGMGLVLISNTRSGSINAIDVQVQGIFSSYDSSFDDHAIRLPLALAQRLVRTPGIETMLVQLDTIHSVETVKAALNTWIHAQGKPYIVKAWNELHEAQDIEKLSQVWKSMYRVVRIIILAGVFLGIMNTMNMVVLERVGEIGTLQAIGMRRRDVAKLFMLEGAVFGLVGGIAGCTLGAGLAVLISHIGIYMPPPPGSNIPWIARIALSPEILIGPLVFSGVTGWISSILPAYKAASLEIADALRRNI
jgi:putative ABC transport system permease protein